MYRFAIEKLLKWKQSKRRKPLIIEGARQVGKTWLMKEFGRQAYADTIYINFDSNSRMAELFASDLDTERLLMGLELYVGRKIDPVDSLLIFDEVQEVPRALTSLKYFYENAPQYHIICAGSLLGIALHQGTSFPVGKVDFLKLYPLSFREFLMATDKERFVELLDKRDFQMITSFRQTYIDALKQYYFVGGMPEAVQSFAENKDFNEVREIQKRILAAYEQDFRGCVCCGTAFLLSWLKKTRSLSTAWSVRELVQKTMKPRLCGSATADLFIKSIVSTRPVFLCERMRT